MPTEILSRVAYKTKQEIFRGDTKALSIALTWEGSAFVPGADWDLIFTVKEQLTDSDSSAKIQKVSPDSISVTGSTASVSILPEDTEALYLDLGYYYDIQAQHVSTFAVRTVASGRLVLIADVTRETEVSLSPPVSPGVAGFPVRSLPSITALEGGTSACLDAIATTGTDAIFSVGQEVRLPLFTGGTKSWLLVADPNSYSGTHVIVFPDDYDVDSNDVGWLGVD